MDGGIAKHGAVYTGFGRRNGLYQTASAPDMRRGSRASRARLAAAFERSRMLLCVKNGLTDRSYCSSTVAGGRNASKLYA